jgi:Tfp pilus assembly protein PilF
LVPLEARAAEAREAGDNAGAERLVLDILELAPGRIRALGLLHAIRKEAGNAPAAEALIRRIVALDPNNFAATAELAFLLLSKGDIQEANIYARNCVRLAPDNAQAHNLMGMVQTEAHRPVVGEFHLRRALEIAQLRDPTVLANLALCLKNQGRIEEARALYAESLTLSPDTLHTLLGLARLEEADRNLAAALALLDRAETLAPGHAGAALLRATVLGRMGEAAAALGVLDAMQDSLGAADLLEKGRLLDRMGRYDDAFAAFEAGKARLREASGHAYLEAHAQAHAARLTRFFTASRLRTLPRARVAAQGAQPVFVLGFPRSGTTLLEQMLSAHPRLAAGDELPLIAEITHLMPRMLESPLSYPEALAELWMGDHHGDLDNLRDYYLQKVAQLGVGRAGADWFTDKMPLNETDLGLITLMFPQAPLIHVIRHPLDVVLSVFSNLLTHGFFCAYALESVARHYVLVSDLVEHYRLELDLRYLPVRYEAMVDDQEGSIRRVLGFIGADFHAGCLRFEDNKRYARTASYAQVSEKLYDRSRFRYRRYLAHLAPVIPILAPVMERLGYEV